MHEMRQDWPFAAAIIADGGKAYCLTLRRYSDHHGWHGTAIVVHGELPETFDSGHKVPERKRRAVANLMCEHSLRAMLAREV